MMLRHGLLPRNSVLILNIVQIEVPLASGIDETVSLFGPNTIIRSLGATGTGTIRALDACRRLLRISAMLVSVAQDLKKRQQIQRKVALRSGRRRGPFDSTFIRWTLPPEQLLVDLAPVVLLLLARGCEDSDSARASMRRGDRDGDRSRTDAENDPCQRKAAPQ
eukprot:g6826.t1